MEVLVGAEARLGCPPLGLIDGSQDGWICRLQASSETSVCTYMGKHVHAECAHMWVSVCMLCVHICGKRVHARYACVLDNERYKSVALSAWP